MGGPHISQSSVTWAVAPRCSPSLMRFTYANKDWQSFWEGSLPFLPHFNYLARTFHDRNHARCNMKCNTWSVSAWRLPVPGLPGCQLQQWKDIRSGSGDSDSVICTRISAELADPWSWRKVLFLFIYKDLDHWLDHLSVDKTLFPLETSTIFWC